MTQGERIKKIRKALGLTLEKFGEQIGLKKNSVSQIENGKNDLTEANAKAICREFNVNEEWLKDEIGEMFNPEPTTALDALTEEYALSPDDYILIERFVKLSPDKRAIITSYITDVASAIQSKNVGSDSYALMENVLEENNGFPSDLSKLSIDEKVELYRKELEREKKVAEELEVSREDA